jgi:hypothetical protein
MDPRPGPGWGWLAAVHGQNTDNRGSNLSSTPQGMPASGGQPRWMVRTVKPSPMSSRVMSPTNPALRSRRSCSLSPRWGASASSSKSSHAALRGLDVAPPLPAGPRIQITKIQIQHGLLDGRGAIHPLGVLERAGGTPRRAGAHGPRRPAVVTGLSGVPVVAAGGCRRMQCVTAPQARETPPDIAPARPQPHATSDCAGPPPAAPSSRPSSRSSARRMPRAPRARVLAGTAHRRHPCRAQRGSPATRTPRA